MARRPCGFTGACDIHQGGGLTAERQQFREELRLKAAERFAQGEASSVIANALGVNVRSVQRWRQKWEQGGPWPLPQTDLHRRADLLQTRSPLQAHLPAPP
ncbi:helix-turn-helix domain-containing protein [Microbispora cellulosiformans]|uniref:Helix-turn-helix domain-containing protein n=1 Tax=Microbispora cellulosiformans TaxID=2614688 RepID=A0A5J5K231_9ACTN|nr:helix-turn-helix domain-containing protein [Microbispora cellulosiformans]